MKQKEKVFAPFEIMLCIVNRGKADKVIDILNMNGCNKNLISLGIGSGSKSQTGDYFGLGIIEREIVMSIVEKDKLDNVIQVLTDMLNLNAPNTGILTTLPVSSATTDMLSLLGINL